LTPTRTALLDTNAVMELKSDERAAAKSNGWRLTTTPWSFLERLCHLEDQTDFSRARGQLMQFRGIEIVDKPLDRLVAARQASDKPRIWGSHLAYAMLAAVDAASSLDALYRSVIVDEAGQHREIRGCVDRLRGILDREKKKFQKLVTDVINLIKSADVPVMTAEERHQAVLDMLVAGESSFRDTEDLDYKKHASAAEILTFEYVYYSYAVSRSIAQYEAGGTTCAMNDFVDGQICAYVPLDEQMWILTGDEPLQEALSATCSQLGDIGMGKRACFKGATLGILAQRGSA